MTFASQRVQYGRGLATGLSPSRDVARDLQAGAELVPEVDRYLSPSGLRGEASYISASFRICQSH